MFPDPVPNQTQGIDTIPIINHEIHRTIEIENIHIIETEVIQTIEIRIIQKLDLGIIHIIDQIITDQMIITKIEHEIIHKIETQVTIIDTEIIPSHHIGIITVTLTLDNQSSTPKHQRHINQVQTNEETTSDPPGIDDTESHEIQLNHIHCESSDTESDTENMTPSQ